MLTTLLSEPAVTPPAATAPPGGPPRFAVTIPALQAAPTVGEVVRRAKAFADTVLVVDDGSTDATAAIAREAGAEVLRLDQNRGKGHALRRAFALLFERGYDAVVTVDADGQHLPEEIPKLLAGAAGIDLVLGTRNHAFEGMVWHRQLSNRISTRAISALAGCSLPDVQTGFRLYRRRLIETVGFPEDRFDAESGVVVRAGRSGFKIACVPVELARADGRGTSHFRPFVDSVRIARTALRARFERRRR